ncbi:hypothetical protein EAH89_27265 [Roseomonas nepalensis]|uniref:Tc1-like transposase DDE domain-containing protein n=1 Tax=Muricoccus nepalensis TaxID=1854500 RepID=A0A502F2Q3_9PROT|nr:hypothetical protein [Roseomonas nepalensis]TPG44303.1 hypothetical protein EAH89_27265 [Roseomonas nepalensis]
MSTIAMAVFLEHFAATLATDDHAVLVLDQAGWHGSRHLRMPNNITVEVCRPVVPAFEPDRSQIRFNLPDVLRYRAH